jgi:DNA invertase Pin-like site-specific DNA recombinase
MSETIRSMVAALTRSERRRKQRELKEQQKKQGKQYPPTYTLPNRKSNLKTVNEEKAAIQYETEEKLKVYVQLLRDCLRNWHRFLTREIRRKSSIK